MISGQYLRARRRVHGDGDVKPIFIPAFGVSSYRVTYRRPTGRLRAPLWRLSMVDDLIQPPPLQQPAPEDGSEIRRSNSKRDTDPARHRKAWRQSRRDVRRSRRSRRGR